MTLHPFPARPRHGTWSYADLADEIARAQGRPRATPEEAEAVRRDLEGEPAPVAAEPSRLRWLCEDALALAAIVVLTLGCLVLG